MSEDQLSGAWPSETLPRSWVWLPFDQFWLDFTDSQKKLPLKDYLSEGRFAVVDQGEARIGGFSNDERLLSHAPVPAIVFGDHTRAVKFIDVPFIQGADGVRVLSTPVGIDRAYAFNALRAVELPDKGYSRHFKFLKATSFPLPPLAEQKRIVAKLDALNAKSARARTELARIETLVSRYKQAVLSKAFSGELTASFERGNSAALLDTDSDVDQLWSLPETWTWCRTDQIGRVGLGRQRSPKNHEGPQMRPYLRSANITWAGVDTSDVKEMNFDDADFKRFKLEVGDVLLNEGSGSAKEVGKPAIWRAEIADCCYQNTLLRVQPHRCSSEYAYYYFLLTARAGGFVSSTQGVNIQHIGREGLACYPFPLAPEPEQHEIVRRIESAFAKIDRLAKEAKRALELVARLDEAILAKAFRGELVAQDENDEPAEHLLARIRAERDKAPKVKKRAVKRASAMLTARDFLNAKLPNWPHDGISFQDLRNEFSGSYDDLKDAVFTLLSDENALLRQVFDEKRSVMTLKRRER